MLSIAANVAARTAKDVMLEEVSQQQEVSQEQQGQQEQQGYIKKTPGKGYCVKSEKNSDWSGGCYPSKGEAKDRLQEVEMHKHMNSSSLADTLPAIMHNASAFLELRDNPPQELLRCLSASIERGLEGLERPVARRIASLAGLELDAPETGIIAQSHFDAVIAATEAVETLKSKNLLDQFQARPEVAAVISEMLGHVEPMTGLFNKLVTLAQEHQADLELTLRDPEGDEKIEIGPSHHEQQSQQEQQAKAPPGWKKTVEHMKDEPDIDNPFALAWYMKNKGDKPHKKK